MRKGKSHLLELTSVRFIAALSVVLMHFSEYLALPQPWAQVLGAGGIGVTFFFVLSGFVLTYNYRDTFESGVRFHEFRDFFLARLFRIYPAYFLAKGLYFLECGWNVLRQVQDSGAIVDIEAVTSDGPV